MFNMPQPPDDDRCPFRGVFTDEEFNSLLKSFQCVNNLDLLSLLSSLTMAEFALTHFAAEYPRQNGGQLATVAEAAQTLNVSMPAVSRTLRGLIEKGCLARICDETDRRVVRIEVTPDGREKLSLSWQECGAFMQKVLSAFSGEEISQLVALYNKFATSAAAVMQEHKQNKNQSRDKQIVSTDERR